MTLLHACVRYNPHVPLLLKMTELHPESLRIKDCIDRTPLHVAAGSGVSLFVIRILTSKYPHACNIQDEDGRTPLHFACDTNCELFKEDKESSPRGPPCLDTVYALLAGSLDAVTLEDVNDMNAVEYALISDAPIEVITLLQITCNPQTVNAIVPAIKPSGNHLLRISGVLSTVFNRIFFF